MAVLWRDGCREGARELGCLIQLRVCVCVFSCVCVCVSVACVCGQLRVCVFNSLSFLVHIAPTVSHGGSHGTGHYTPLRPVSDEPCVLLVSTFSFLFYTLKLHPAPFLPRHRGKRDDLVGTSLGLRRREDAGAAAT